MKRRSLLLFRVLVFVVLLPLTIVTNSYADDVKNEPKKKAEPKTKPVTFTIYGQSCYFHNFNNPPSKLNDFHIFDQKAERILPDLFQVIMDKGTLLTDRFGFRIKLSAGETARYIHAYGLGNNMNNVFDLTETYVRYKAPIGKGLDIEAGKFVTFIGGESIEAINNPNYSRSFLYNYATPITHTGLRFGYVFSDQFSAGLYVVQGCDNFKDNNTAKTLGSSLTYTPSSKFTTTFNFMSGPEQTNNNSNNRFLFDWIATYKPDKKWTIYANYDYGREQNVPLYGTSYWTGVSGIVKRDITDTFSLALRAEVFKDAQGYRTGVPQTLKEITFSLEYRLTSDFIIRPEFRHDWSNVQSFDGGKTNKQSILGIGVIYQHQW